jgi:hypothetical protein
VFVRILPYDIPQRTAQIFMYHCIIKPENNIYFEFLYKFVWNIKVIKRIQKDFIINVDKPLLKATCIPVIFS